MMIGNFYKVLLVFAFFQLVEIHCKDDHGDVPGYGIYDIFIKTEEEVTILQEMISNKIINVINKKDPFKWKVLVRANNEAFLQRKLIEHRMAYIIVKSSLTAQPNDLSTVQRDYEEYYDDKDQKRNDQRKFYPQPSYNQPYAPPPYYNPYPYMPAGYNPYPYNPNFNRYDPYYNNYQ